MRNVDHAIGYKDDLAAVGATGTEVDLRHGRRKRDGQGLDARVFFTTADHVRDGGDGFGQIPSLVGNTVSRYRAPVGYSLANHEALFGYAPGGANHQVRCRESVGQAEYFTQRIGEAPDEVGLGNKVGEAQHNVGGRNNALGEIL